MNDMLLHVKRKKERAEFKRKTPLTATTLVTDVPDSKSEKNAFKVGDIIFSASTPQEKVTIMKDIDAVITKLKPGEPRLERTLSMHTTVNNLLQGVSAL